MGRVITLTTDFGLVDGYVGTVKGVILGINPDATVVDITHEIGPQDVFQAAFVLGTSYTYFPSSSIHLAVVDPGVGSERSALALCTPKGTFVGPDNGVLTWPVIDCVGEATESRSGLVHVPSGGPVKVVRLTESQFWLKNPSRTFHGRDVFAPVAAYLSLGSPLESLGEELTDIVVLPIPAPQKHSPDRVDGEVLMVDRFGNLITNLAASDIDELGGNAAFRMAGQVIRGLSDSYREKQGLLAIIGSAGYVEIALQNGSAAQRLKLGRGARVTALKPSLKPSRDGGNA